MPGSSSRSGGDGEEAAAVQVLLARCGPWLAAAAMMILAGVIGWQTTKIDRLEEVVFRLEGKVEALSEDALERGGGD